jgi:hypothetical protein
MSISLPQSFSSIVLAQSMEFFLFGGRGSSHLAGRCKLPDTQTNTHTMTRQPSRRVTTTLPVSRPSTIKSEAIVSPHNRPSPPHSELDEGIMRQVSFESPADEELDDPLHHRHTLDRDIDRKIEEGARKRYTTIRHSPTASGASPNSDAPLRPLSMMTGGSKAALMEWTCVTCAAFNRQPRHPRLDPEVVSRSVGLVYSRTFAVVRPARDMPRCHKCLTDADYVPSKATAHLFANYRERYYAFSNYPAKADSHGTGSASYGWGGKAKALLSGLHGDADSLLLHNDWRMRKYLPSRFMEITRPLKKDDECFRRGEIIESKHQKVAWTRGRVITVRANKTYDIT